MLRRSLVLLLVITFGFVSQAWSVSPLVERILGSRKVISTLYFNDNSYLIDADGRAQLEMLVEAIKEEIANGRFVRAEGYASNEGRDIYSFKLALQRAKMVVDFYKKRSDLPEIYMTGYGDLKDQGNNPKNEWRVEIATYENLVDVRLVKKKVRFPMIAQPKQIDQNPLTTIDTGDGFVPVTTIEAGEDVAPITTIGNGDEAAPITTIDSGKEVSPLTTIDTGDGFAPVTTIEAGEDVAPITTIGNGDEAAPITTIDSGKEVSPLTTIDTGDGFAPVTTIEAGEDVAPLALAAPHIDTSPISSPSLRGFQMGHMGALAKLDEPLIIDALAIEEAIRKKLEKLPEEPTGSVSQVQIGKSPGN